MISNPGFSFANLNGTYKIVPIENTDMDNVDPLYSEAIVCEKVGTLVQIYTDQKGLSKVADSVALKFSKINIHNNDEILSFFKKYGSPMSERNFANFRNDYIFFKSNKDKFTERIPLIHKERNRLADIKKDIVSMNYLLDLNAAIGQHDLNTIVKIITYFCFDLTNHYSSPDAHCVTELSRFNRDFRCFAESEGYIPFSYKDYNFSFAIKNFLESIVADFQMEQIFHQHGQPFRRQYVDYDFTEWRHLRALYADLLSETEILQIDPFGDVKFSKPISECDYLKQLNPDNLINLAKAIFTDLFTEKLHRVTPEVQIENGRPIAGWRIPTFIDAMYLELFFRISPTGQMKRCADPSCRGHFEWTPSRPNQKYCSNVCALRVAKRNQRQREKSHN